MEIWIRRIFLTSFKALLGMALLLTSTLASSDEPIKVEESTVVLEPQIIRLELDEAELDNENFEVGFYFNRISVEDFGSNNGLSISFAYHISEDFFVEANATQASLQAPLEESFVGSVTFSDSLDYANYNFSVGMHILPGEVFLWRDMAFNFQIYAIGGVGVTQHFLDAKDTSYNVGIGSRLILTDWLAFRMEVNDHMFKRDSKVAKALGENSQPFVHNIELRAGLSLFF